MYCSLENIEWNIEQYFPWNWFLILDRMAIINHITKYVTLLFVFQHFLSRGGSLRDTLGCMAVPCSYPHPEFTLLVWHLCVYVCSCKWIRTYCWVCNNWWRSPWRTFRPCRRIPSIHWWFWTILIERPTHSCWACSSINCSSSNASKFVAFCFWFVWCMATYSPYSLLLLVIQCGYFVSTWN